MATRTEVVEKHNEGLNAAQIAEALGISRNGVYNHLRRSNISLSGNGGKRNGAGRGRGKAKAKSIDMEEILAAAGVKAIPATIEGEHPAVAQIRSQIGDSIENLELEMHLKRAELDSLERQHQQLYNMLTVPLPDAASE